MTIAEAVRACLDEWLGDSSEDFDANVSCGYIETIVTEAIEQWMFEHAYELNDDTMEWEKEKGND